MKVLALIVLAMALSACGTSDDDYQIAVIGTWASREVGLDDVIVETQTTLLPGGRVNWNGELRLPVPSTFYVPRGVSHEVKNGRLVFYFAASGAWFVRDGYLHTKVESSTLPSMMPVGFSSAWQLKEVSDKELIYLSAANGRTRVEQRRD
ncbi:MAG: hypothetical protein JSW48_14820 [Betaproteobacteria bacterium]|jgi:hypothetical protein|nr:MAG: hypothetical protein JSW48_14820 [Betaproteobacteria bacterium]